MRAMEIHKGVEDRGERPIYACDHSGSLGIPRAHRRKSPFSAIFDRSCDATASASSEKNGVDFKNTKSFFTGHFFLFEIFL